MEDGNRLPSHTANTSSSPALPHSSSHSSPSSAPPSSTSSSLPRYPGMSPLGKVVMGMFFTLGALIASTTIEYARRRAPLVEVQGTGFAVSPSETHDVSRYVYTVVFCLTSIGVAIHFLGALQFLFDESPPFLRCSSTGLLLFGQGLGYIFSSFIIYAFSAAISGPFQYRHPDSPCLFYLHLSLLVMICVNIIMFLALKHWYQKKHRVEDTVLGSRMQDGKRTMI